VDSIPTIKLVRTDTTLDLSQLAEKGYFVDHNYYINNYTSHNVVVHFRNGLIKLPLWLYFRYN